MNSVQLIGNLARDCDYRLTNGGDKQTAVCRFPLAVEDGYGENKRVSYPNIVVFGKQAETCNQYLKKGSKVAVNGRIQTGSYEKDGRKIYTTDIVATRVEFLGGGARSENKAEAPKEPDIPDGFSTLDDDDDIPF